MDEEQIKDRVLALVESTSMNRKEFAKFTNVAEATLSQVINGKTRPTLQFVEAIHKAMPNVSVEWLMFGSGTMYAQSEGSSAETNDQSSAAADSQGATHVSEEAPTLFSPRPTSGPVLPKAPAQHDENVVKYIDKPQRKITEIRVFYDDQTWESFSPKH